MIAVVDLGVEPGDPVLPFCWRNVISSLLPPSPVAFENFKIRRLIEYRHVLNFL